MTEARCCYVTLEFPVLSQTFVTDEIAAIEDAGASVLTVSMEGGDGADVALAGKRARSWWTIRRVVSLLVHRPSAAPSLLGGSLTFGLRMKLLATAEVARRFGVTTVHAHFAYRSADGAEVIGRALGVGHSVTAHARDIFVPNGDLEGRLHRARTVVTVCEYNRDWLVDHFGPTLANKIVVIPCSTDVELPPVRRLPTGLPVIVAVGRLVPKKGFDILLEAVARLYVPCRLVIVGDGPEREPLQQQASELGLNDVVQFTGALDHADTLAWLRSADLFCVPFRIGPDGDRDSMPVVVKEAMAAGVAVVSTNEVGVPEMVVDGETGLLVDPDDIPALAEALDRLLSDPRRRAAMGMAGRRLAEERFDLRMQARRLLEVFGCSAA
jgi:colanic acid/amylovoran biosynthesis glycosyltransferase